MTLTDFANGAEPWLDFGRGVDTNQVRIWHEAGFLITHEKPVDYFASRFWLSNDGRRESGLPFIAKPFVESQGELF